MRIVIPSMGRCGSTAVAVAIIAAFEDYHHDFIRHPRLFPSEGVFKTHCWAPPELAPGDKYVYVYGSAVEAAISAHSQSEEFLIMHYANMGGSLALRRLWHLEDTLHIRQNLESWKVHRGSPQLLFFHYDEIFTDEGADRLSEFLGRCVILPERHDRATHFDPHNEQHRAAAETYAGIGLD